MLQHSISLLAKHGKLFFVVSIELNRFASQAEFFGQQDWDACRGRECRIWGHGKGSAESGQHDEVSAESGA
jgi:hypothetical protein